MKALRNTFYITLLVLQASVAGYAQEAPKKVVVTGVRFSYPLVEKWIKDYKQENPTSTVVIESRSTSDPAQYDLLLEAYEPTPAVKDTREYLYLARYVLLPVANANSAFAKAYEGKGLTTELIKQVYFNDIYANKKDAKVAVNYTIYTRLQKAGAPITFAKYFGFEQVNIKGKAIAGADEHLVKALLKDSSAISYSVPGLLYNLETRHQLDGLTIIPVDADGNGKVSNEEKFYASLDDVITHLEAGELKNIPYEHLHLSIAKNNTNAEAVKFFQWVLNHSQDDLHHFGFIKPEPKRFQQQKEKLKGLTLN